MMNHASLEDRTAIRELVEGYNDAVMRNDGEAWLATWAEDGVWSLQDLEPRRGRAAIIQLWREMMATISTVGFFGQPGAIRIDGDRGEGRWWQQEQLHFADGSWVQVLGEYTDEYVRESDGWRFASRTYRIVERRELGGGRG